MEAVGTTSKRRHIREPPSVPFLWEERPGIAKKNWTKPAAAAQLPPVKLIASVPFNWEEKPGTPLSQFSRPSEEDRNHPSPGKLLPLLPAVPFDWEEKPGTPVSQFSRPSEEDRNHPSPGKLLPLPPALCSNEKYGGVSDWYSRSPPALLANCLIPSAAISAAVPVVDSFSTAEIMDAQWEMPHSPEYESDGSTSSYETGRSSLVGSSFLECLFPLYRQASAGSLEKEASQPEEKRSSTPPLELTGGDVAKESDGAVTIRRPPTLGELIMMSRRRSIQRKAARMRLHTPSVKLLEGEPFRCSIFPSSLKMVEGLQRKIHQTRLALL